MKKLVMTIFAVVAIMMAMAMIRTDERTFVTSIERYEMMDPYGDGTVIKEVRKHGSYREEFNMVKDPVVTFRRTGHRKLSFER